MKGNPVDTERLHAYFEKHINKSSEWFAEKTGYAYGTICKHRKSWINDLIYANSVVDIRFEAFEKENRDLKDKLGSANNQVAQMARQVEIAIAKREQQARKSEIEVRSISDKYLEATANYVELKNNPKLKENDVRVGVISGFALGAVLTVTAAGFLGVI